MMTRYNYCELMTEGMMYAIADALRNVIDDILAGYRDVPYQELQVVDDMRHEFRRAYDAIPDDQRAAEMYCKRYIVKRGWM